MSAPNAAVAALARFRLDGVCAPPAWMNDAQCQDAPYLPWTTDRVHTSEYERQTMADICAQCPVLADCSAFADQQQISGGFWAGQPREWHQVRNADKPDQLAADLPPLPRPPGHAPVPTDRPAQGRDQGRDEDTGTDLADPLAEAPGPAGDPSREPARGEDQSHPSPTTLAGPASPRLWPVQRPWLPSEPVVSLARLAAGLHDVLYEYEAAVRAGRDVSARRVALYGAVEDLYRHAKTLATDNQRLRVGRGVA